MSTYVNLDERDPGLIHVDDPDALLQHGSTYQPVDEATLIEIELVSRKLAKRRLINFVERFTPDFTPGWHLDEIAAECEQIEQKIQRKRGTDARLILEAPPRHGKSQTTSRCLPLWYLGRHPEHEVIVATYGQDLADDLGRWAKACLKDPAFKAVFPDLELRKDSQAANRLDTTKGGGIRYVGVGAALTGRGGHLIVCDDLVKDAEAADSEAISEATWAWYTSVLRTRLAPGGGIIVMHTRWRLNDPIGRLLKMEEEGGEAYKRVTFPALNEDSTTNEWGMKPGETLHPNRFGREDMLATKKALPARDWRSLYMQKPMADEGNIFKVKEFDLYPAHQVPKRGIYWGVAADLAYSTDDSADHSVIMPFGIDHEDVMWFHPDYTRGRMTTDRSIERILDYACELDAKVIVIEGGQAWRAIEPEFKRRMRARGRYFTIDTPSPTKDKYTRSRPLHTRMQAGLVRWPDTTKFKHMTIPEFVVFTGKNDDEDDQVDAAAWAGYAVADMVRPYDGDTPSGQEEDDDVVDWSMADVNRRTPVERPKKRKHVPDTLRGEIRGRSSRYHA